MAWSRSLTSITARTAYSRVKVISDVATNMNADALSSCPNASRDELLDALRAAVADAPLS